MRDKTTTTTDETTIDARVEHLCEGVQRCLQLQFKAKIFLNTNNFWREIAQTLDKDETFQCACVECLCSRTLSYGVYFEKLCIWLNTYTKLTVRLQKNIAQIQFFFAHVTFIVVVDVFVHENVNSTNYMESELFNSDFYMWS